MTDVKAQDVIFACSMWIDIHNKIQTFEVCDDCFEHAMMAADIAYAEYSKLITAYKEQVERDQKLHNQIVEEVAELLGTKEVGSD
jgi:hypothetical protein